MTISYITTITLCVSRKVKRCKARGLLIALCNPDGNAQAALNTQQRAKRNLAK